MMFKDMLRHHSEWWQIDPRLRQIATEIEVAAYPLVMFVTCLYRTEDEQLALYRAGQAPAQTSVHCVGRGLDFRPFEDEDLNEWLLKDINAAYSYDVNRPHLQTLIRHEGTKDHMHLQVRPIDEIDKLFKGAVKHA
jgi:hypothetical protein